MTVVPEPTEGVRRIMTATARLLAGEGGNPESLVFNHELMLIVGGALDMMGSVWLASVARLNRRSVAHLAFLAENENIPIVTFAHFARNGSVSVYEGCMLWTANAREPVRIIRTDMDVAFQMSRKGRMCRRRAPVETVEASVPGLSLIHI